MYAEGDTIETPVELNEIAFFLPCTKSMRCQQGENYERTHSVQVASRGMLSIPLTY